MKVARYLMCRSSYFGVSYVINPWMKDQVGQADTHLAVRQWDQLYRIFTQEIGVPVELIDPVDGLPDMVFTANAGFVTPCSFVPSRFKFPERQGEEAHFIQWFSSQGYELKEIPGYQEGAGDILLWSAPTGDSTLLCAHGFRSDAETADRIDSIFPFQTLSVRLVDPRFYHLDTCFCPLPDGHVLWFPPAFDEESQARIRQLIPESLRFEARSHDADKFCCNAVGLAHQGQRHIVMGHVGPDARSWLESKDFRVHVTDLSEFLKAGGSAKCLTLRLDGAEV
jgi:N-dimethylarginine dimethylaminohydrolase